MALSRESFLLVSLQIFLCHKIDVFKTYIKLLTKIKCKPSSNKFSAQLLLLSINPSPFNLQTRFRMLFTAITLTFNLFCALHINNEIKTSFTLLSLHCRPILTFHSAISFSVSCLLPISLQPMCSIKTSGVRHLRLVLHISPFVSEWRP